MPLMQDFTDLILLGHLLAKPACTEREVWGALGCFGVLSVQGKQAGEHSIEGSEKKHRFHSWSLRFCRAPQCKLDGL